MIKVSFITALVGLYLVAFMLAAPSFKDSNTTKQKFKRVWVVFFGVIIPLAAFFLSMLLSPSWKSQAILGWIDCFLYGKIALIPLFLWAVSSFYVATIKEKQDPDSKWVVLGLLTGTSISGLSSLHLLILSLYEGMKGAGILLILIVFPLYVTVWYAKHALIQMREVPLSVRDFGYTILGSLPFWGLSLYLSKNEYDSLGPSPQCFVVTAASKGHKSIVGPFVTVVRRGEARQVNQQLVLFWKFEELWSKRTPVLHQLFRNIYNVAGPFIARRIQAKLVADIVYLMLKPAEVLVRFVVRKAQA